MIRALAVALALVPLGAWADMTSTSGARAAEAIRLGAERQALRSGVTLRQSGRGNEAAMSQSGTNQGIIVQRGRGHFALLSQTGTGNAATIVQLGRGSSVVVEQTGGESTTSVQVGR